MFALFFAFVCPFARLPAHACAHPQRNMFVCLLVLASPSFCLVCVIILVSGSSDFSNQCLCMLLRGRVSCFGQNKEVLDAAIRDERDFEYDYFGFKTLEKSYLLRQGTATGVEHLRQHEVGEHAPRTCRKPLRVV